MCQCSGLLKEKAGYFERLKIFLKVTGLLRTYDMKIENWKWRPFEGSSRFVSLTAFGGPWHDGGGRGVGGCRSSQSRVSEVKTIEGSTSPLSQFYQVSVISCWGENYRWHTVKFFILSLQLFPQDRGSEVSKQRPPTSKQNSLNWSWPRVNHSGLK